MSGTCGTRSVLPRLRTEAPCEVRSEVRKRSGTPLWWCHAHGVEAPLGVGSRCPGADTPALRGSEIIEIDVHDYPGGVAVWGATPPAVSWGPVTVEAGVHLHARVEVGGPKVIDGSFAVVRVTSQEQTIEIDEASAVAQLISLAAGQTIVSLVCPHCDWRHLDRDQFAVDPHRKHLCNRCGRNFWATDLTISNPLAVINDRPEFTPTAPTVTATDSIHLERDNYSSIAIWGSNPAIIWTSPMPQAEGIHVHAWDATGALVIDETYGSVTVDGVNLDPILVRLLMIQRALSDAESRLVSLVCPLCGTLHVESGAAALQPKNSFICTSCRQPFLSPGRRKVLSNPLLAILRGRDS